MNKRLCVYTIILVVLLIVSLFVSKNDKEDLIKWFDFGNKQILSLKYESNNIDVEIVKQDRQGSKQRLQEFKTLKNKGVYFVKYTAKNIDPNNKKSNHTDSVVLQGSKELNAYLESYSPFFVEKSFESDDLESFGIKESSPKITIQYENIAKTILVGNSSFDNVKAYYYDPEKKSILIQEATLTEMLNDALKALVSYTFSDTRSQDVSYMKVSSSGEEKTLYKVNTIKDSKETPSWSLTPNGEGNDSIVEWVGRLVLIKVLDYLNISNDETQKVLSISMFNSKNKLIDSIEIAKYKDEYVGKTNYTGSWVSVDKDEVEKILNQFRSL